MPLTYPARIMFALTSPQRSVLLAAAARLKLPIEFQAEGVVIVTVPDPVTAYQLGRQCAGQPS